MKRGIYGPQEFARDTRVSRETLERLEAYAALLQTWNKTTNLVGPSTIPGLWSRHFLDSAQLFPMIQDISGLVDIGSGAGFPGLILAILGKTNVKLIESDQRKAAFLREAARITATDVTILPVRLESLTSLPSTQITARAFAPIVRLLEDTARFITHQTKFVLLKGQNVGVELTEAHKIWRMAAETTPSQTDPTASIVILREVSRVPSGSR